MPDMERRKGYLLVGMLLLLVVIAPLYNRQTSSSKDGQSAAAPAPATPVDPAATRQEIDSLLARRGESMVRTMLKDPDSARFSGTFGRVKKGEWVACGYVNSKNSFGAMAGNAGWVALPAKGHAYVEADENGAFYRNWNRYCTGREDAVDTDVTPMHIASREIKLHGKQCGTVVSARLLKDNSINATCSTGARYRLNYLDEIGSYITFRCEGADQLPSNRC